MGSNDEGERRNGSSDFGSWLPSVFKLIGLIHLVMSFPLTCEGMGDAREVFDFPFGPGTGDKFSQKLSFLNYNGNRINITSTFMSGVQEIDQIEIYDNSYFALWGTVFDYLNNEMCVTKNDSSYYTYSGYRPEVMCSFYHYLNNILPSYLEPSNPTGVSVFNTPCYGEANSGPIASIYQWDFRSPSNQLNSTKIVKDIFEL